MKIFLVKMDADWADEFNVKGFSVMTEEQLDKLKKLAKEHFAVSESLTCSFGTNEELEFNSEDDIMRSFSVTEITEEESEMLKRLFNPGYATKECLSFGTSHPGRILDSLNYHSMRRG